MTQGSLFGRWEILENRVKENQSKGFVVLYRSLLDWEYVDDDAVFSCFAKILLAVNYQDKKWHGQEVKRGSLIGSIENLCSKLKMKKDTLRRCLKLLNECGAITVEVVPNKYHIITVTNYSLYQDRVVEKTANRTNNRTNNRAVNRTNNKTINSTDNKTNNKTDNKPDTTKQYNNINKETSGGVCPPGTHTPPQEENKAALPSVTPLGGEPSEPLNRREWRTYCELKGYNEYRAAEEWIKVGGIFTEGQKRKVREWLKEHGEE